VKIFKKISIKSIFFKNNKHKLIIDSSQEVNKKIENLIVTAKQLIINDKKQPQ
jgi:hypothetical protein